LACTTANTPSKSKAEYYNTYLTSNASLLTISRTV
jgi:hypothetical protein